MLFNKYSDMTKELHHTTYLQPYASGIYYLRYTGTSSPLPAYLSGEIDSSIADLIVENKYFILENIINDGMLLQRITLNKSNNIYFRTGKLSSKIVSGFMTRYTINELKNSLSCLKCRENRNHLLDFHHVDPNQKTSK